MKHRKLIYSAILVCTTLALLWALPALVRKATGTPADYPFVYYSSVMKGFGLIDYRNKELPLADLAGRRYTPRQFDSLMPMLNYRQLMSDGRLPDSMGGYEITPRLLRTTSVVFRYDPAEENVPGPNLYILFESMPKRVGLEIPSDVFRLHDNIEFIDATANTTEREKSETFRRAFDKAGFRFPARWASGNPNPRKAYDEGYFCLDAEGKLYHLKMVNGRPYVRDTHLGDSIDIRSFSMYEAPDRRFYGFLFDRQGGIRIVESDEAGGYRPLKLDMPPIDPQRERVTVMGNLFYWTVTVESPAGRRYYALETPTLRQVDTHAIAAAPNRWERVSRWLFPLVLTFRHDDTAFIAPRFVFTGLTAMAANLLAAAATWLLATGCRRKRAALTLYVLLTGLAGLLAAVLLPDFRRKYPGNQKRQPITNNDKQ